MSFKLADTRLAPGEETRVTAARLAPMTMGRNAARRGVPMDANPFFLAHEMPARAAWNDGWMSEAIRLLRGEAVKCGGLCI